MAETITDHEMLMIIGGKEVQNFLLKKQIAELTEKTQQLEKAIEVLKDPTADKKEKKP